MSNEIAHKIVLREFDVMSAVFGAITVYFLHYRPYK